MPCPVVLEDGQPKPEQCIGRKLKFETLITINWDDFRAAESNPGRDSSSALFDIALSTQSTALLYNEKKDVPSSSAFRSPSDLELGVGCARALLVVVGGSLVPYQPR